MRLARIISLTILAAATFHGTSNAQFIVNGVIVDTPAATIDPSSVAPQRPALAVFVNFDNVSAPCIFNNTVALRNEYAGLGVIFSGPAPTAGGAILDQCGNFSVFGYSAPNFVAFNSNPGAHLQDGGAAIGPERMDFSQDVGSIQLTVGGPGGGVAKLTAYSAANVLLATDTVPVLNAMQGLTVNAPGIRYALLEVQGAEDNVWVFDDLSFDTMPTASLRSTWGRVKTAYR